MRWSWVGFMAVLVFASGCGVESYNKRLEATIAAMKRDNRYSKNLEKAPSNEKRFTDLRIFVRPPKGETLSKVGMLNAPEGQFEVNDTFAEKGADPALHLLARVKLPKKPPAKGQAAPAAPAPRGEFNRDVLDILTTQFGPAPEFAAPKWAQEQKGENRFQRLIVLLNDKEFRIYSYKKDNTEAALIFVHDPKVRDSLIGKIDDTLTTFATGDKAKRTYDNNGTDPGEDAEAAPTNPV